MIIIGLDPSVSCTGVVVRAGDTTRWMLVDPRKLKLSDPGRQMYIAAAVRDFCLPDEYTDVLCVIEGIGGHLLGNARIAVSLHHFIRAWNGSHSVKRGARVNVLAVAGTRLKKFITGKGNAEKGQVGAAIQKRWGRELGGDSLPEHVLDAFALMKFGEMRLLGDNCAAPQWQKDIASQGDLEDDTASLLAAYKASKVHQQGELP